MNKEAIVIGYSGHSFVLIDTLLSNKIKVTGYCDKQEKVNNPFHLSYLGCENDENVLEELKKYNVYLGIGDNFTRSRIFEYLLIKKIQCPALIHKYSCVSLQANIGLGTVIMPGVVINSGTKVGNAAICNSSCVIEHECFIGDYSHIAPGAVLAGNVSVGSNTFIGANSVIKQGVKIGSNVIVGAGAVVIKSVGDKQTIYGNPAK